MLKQLFEYLHRLFLLAREGEENRAYAMIENFQGDGYTDTMTTKAAAANGVSGREEKQLAVIDGYLEEMASIRKRMKSTDARIRRADGAIRRTLDEAWAILRHVQAAR